MAVSVCCGDSVFRARPSAPASSAERNDSPSLYAVSTRTFGGAVRSRRAAITSVPLMLVSSRSRTTTSGLCCSTSFTTSVPSVVQAATVISDSPSSSARRPSSTMAWSSARSTWIMVPASFGGQRDGERRASTGRALERERAAQHRYAVLDPAQPEMPAFDADVFLARQHALRVEAPAVVRHGERDGLAPSLDRHALAGGARVAVAVREPLLQDPVDRDFRGERAVAQVRRELELHRLIGERLVLDREPLDDLPPRAALEAGRAERAEEVAALAQGPLEQAHRLAHPLLGRGIRGERALEHLELRQRGEDVLHRAVVHVEHDALQLALARRQEAPRRGAGIRVALIHDGVRCGSCGPAPHLAGQPAGDLRTP